MGKRWPTVDLALQLFCTTLEDRVFRRDSFVFPAPLVRYELIHFTENPHARDSLLLSQGLRLEPRVANYLLGSDALDERLKSAELLARPDVSWDQVVVSPETRARMEQLPMDLQADEAGISRIVLHLVGPQGIGQKTVERLNQGNPAIRQASEWALQLLFP